MPRAVPGGIPLGCHRIFRVLPWRVETFILTAAGAIQTAAEGLRGEIAPKTNDTRAEMPCPGCREDSPALRRPELFVTIQGISR